jgi:hypothetical protein
MMYSVPFLPAPPEKNGSQPAPSCQLRGGEIAGDEKSEEAEGYDGYLEMEVASAPPYFAN